VSHEYVVYFAHGKESGPWGRKIQALSAVAKRLGFQIESPDYQFTQNPEERTQYLLKLAPTASKALLLVGSSMGGYVSAMAEPSLNVAGLFLMAPALYLPDYPGEPATRTRHSLVVHGLHDTVVPPDNAVRFARQNGSELHLLDSEHTLTDVIPLIEHLFERFLSKVIA
jgi:pimeloyl-ACP methyl ester carboxylesterase